MSVSSRFLKIAACCAMTSIFAPSQIARAADEPNSQWLHAYVLVQTGHQLAEQELWPLAMANYAAALGQFEELATKYPAFQPRLIAFRTHDLKEKIQSANESMNAGEHDLAMIYEDIIDAARIGSKGRYQLDYETAYQFLMRAQWQLKDLLARSPEAMAGALVEQKAYIDEITESSRESLLRMPDGGLKVHNIEKDFAESYSIAMSDLPSFPEIEPAASGMSSALFPDTLVARVRGEWYR